MARNVWLFLTFTFIGPLVGAVTFMLMASALDPVLSRPGSSGLADMADYWPIVLFSCYAFGLVPALVSAIAQIIATRWLPTRQRRLIAASIIGAISSTIILGLFFVSSGFGIQAEWWIFPPLAITGAVSAFASLWLVELFHKLPEPA